VFLIGMEKAVLFDVDGTIVDTVDKEIAAWREALLTAGFDIPAAAIRQQMGKGADQLVPALLPDLSAAEAERLGKVQGEIFRNGYRPSVQPFPRVAELFARLRRDGFVVGLASSGDRAGIRHYERLAGIEGLVDLVACADDVCRSKPAGDVFFAALHMLGFASTRFVLAVGDSIYDAAAARAAGLPTVGVLGGAFDARELRESGCIAVFRDVTALLEEFETSPFATIERAGSEREER
jgi:phosphoglycolate phosphatase-like HAD superfamily hydrolase